MGFQGLTDCAVVYTYLSRASRNQTLKRGTHFHTSLATMAGAAYCGRR